jgi:hypothetical protein
MRKRPLPPAILVALASILPESLAFVIVGWILVRRKGAAA